MLQASHPKLPIVPELGPKELIDKILKDVKAFENGAEQFDDITTLAIQMLVDPSASSGDRISLAIKNRLEEINNVVDRFESNLKQICNA